MAGSLIDGKKVAETVRAEIAREVRDLGIRPGLATLRVGEDPASAVYVRAKHKAAQEAGFFSVSRSLPATAREEEVLAEVESLNRDPAIHGFLVQLPLPRHVRESRVIHAIDPRKDVDGFHPENAGLLLQGTPRFASATPLGVVELLRRERIPTEGRRVVVLGRSNIVGRPLAALLLAKGTDATVTVCHSRTKDLSAVTREGDILVAAIGQPRFVGVEHVKPGAVVVDVGINRLPDGKLVGDVDFEPVREVVSRITPVPGGVGPMTIAMLLGNTLKAAKGV